MGKHHLVGKSPINKFTFERTCKEFNDFGIRVIDSEENYKDISTPIKLECPSCKNEFYFSLFKMRGKQNKTCESCSRKAVRRLITIEEANLHGVNIKTELKVWPPTQMLKFECTKCSSEYERKWSLFEREAKKGNTQCPRCGINDRIEQSREKAKKRFEEFTIQNDIKTVSIGSGISTFICPNCQKPFERGNKYFNRDTYPYRTDLCASCSNGRPSSQQEELLVTELKKVTTVDQNNRKLIPPKEIDIYLPEFKIGVEINGLHFHSESAGKDKNYHINKKIEAKKAGIQLLQFWDIEINEKKDLVLSMIKAKCGLYDRKIFARKTEKRSLLPKEAKVFFEQNHIDGFVGGVHTGLFYKNKLICAITIGSSRFKSGELEILRFATEQGTSVVGGFSKLTKDYDKLVSFANGRFSDGEVYERSGWKKVSEAEPSYWYFKGKKLYHRSSFMKHKLKKNLLVFDEKKTEWENMIINGWDRIWDCGSIKYER